MTAMYKAFEFSNFSSVYLKLFKENANSSTPGKKDENDKEE